MELLIKMPQGKPWKAGVRYVYDYLALRPYETIVRDNPGSEFSMTLEPQGSRIKVILTSNDTGKKYEYSSLEYKPEQLKKFRQLYTTETQLIFVHIYPKHNSLVIARPFGTENLIRINEVEFIAC